MSVQPASARCVLGDWGTTNLRLYLMEQGQVVDVREGAGIGSLGSPPANVLKEMVEGWLGTARPVDVVLGGMASSRNGLCELPYVRAPASFASWAQQAHSMQLGSLNILLATGMQCGTGMHDSDVMRGEEAQIFGATQLDPTLRVGSHYFVLPGTHSKWVEVEHGSITQFQTALTGELYWLLCKHSTLLKANVERTDDTEFDPGFAVGAERSTHVESLLTEMFKARTAQLLDGRSHAWAAGFLSGLLIGHEVAAMSANFAKSPAITLIGEAQLASLYQRVFIARGIATRRLDGATCVLAGLRQLRELCSRASARIT